MTETGLKDQIACVLWRMAETDRRSNTDHCAGTLYQKQIEDQMLTLYCALTLWRKDRRSNTDLIKWGYSMTETDRRSNTDQILSLHIDTVLVLYDRNRDRRSNTNLIPSLHIVLVFYQITQSHGVSIVRTVCPQFSTLHLVTKRVDTLTSVHSREGKNGNHFYTMVKWLSCAFLRDMPTPFTKRVELRPWPIMENFQSWEISFENEC